LEISSRHKAFLDRVKDLNLRFEVAEISKKTNTSKGNVSAFLNAKREPSENFLKRFNEAFPTETQQQNLLREPEVRYLTGEKSSIKEFLDIIKSQADTIKSQQEELRELRQELVRSKTGNTASG
jgi:transcriptional regulator with XRE-family HTH domain